MNVIVTYLLYCTVMFSFAFWSILDSVCCCFEKCRCRFSKVKVRCIFSCIGSGIFWTGIFEMPEVYIMVVHVVDRSLERAGAFVAVRMVGVLYESG